MLKKKKFKMRSKRYRSRYSKKINLILGVPLICIIILEYSTVVIPCCLDMKYVFTGNYLIFQGEVTNEIDLEDRNEIIGERVVLKNNENNMKLNLNIVVFELQKGDIIQVKYLPNLGIGDITEKYN